MRTRRHPVRVRARAGAQRLQLLVADVVPVEMAQQNQMDLAQPRVVGAGEIVGHVVEDANAGRIFEYGRAIVRAKLAGV